MDQEVYRPVHAVRFVTAASLFDGHDASINLFRRLLQSSGAEVIHLGHDRSVDLIVDAAIQEDVQGIAVSSYQGGHVEYFKYMMDRLRERGASIFRFSSEGEGNCSQRNKGDGGLRGSESFLSRGRTYYGPAGND